MNERYDVVVLGLGAMGSATAAHVAARGGRVLGMERFGPAHALGSSHGKTRVIRQAYYEAPAYVPLLLRAYELWDDLERRSGEQLLLRTGGLMVGAPDSEVVLGSARSAREHDLAHELLDATDIRRRFPALRPRDGECGVYEPNAGALYPERCVLAHLQWAAAAGAELRFGMPVVSWAATADGVQIETKDGTVCEAQTLVVCAGAWLGRFCTSFAASVRAERNVMHWFRPRANAESFAVGRLPIYLIERAGEPVLYGFPDISGDGVKVAPHYTGDYTDPDELRRDVAPDEVAAMRERMMGWIPDAAGEHIASVVCMYTNSPDLHFVIGRHPEHANVVVAGGFSGHGFKFSSVIGEILADLAMLQETRHPIDLFAPARLIGQSATELAAEATRK
ncbi:MAG: N-methyl-L-tryptophan oxidase [bacterium]|nr:N-methyl-L-tryptophan oxidase [bacterium]